MEALQKRDYLELRATYMGQTNAQNIFGTYTYRVRGCLA